jgi:hypothetical protein
MGEFRFTAEERAYLAEIRALTTDNEGREVLVGLTREETIAYMEHIRGQSDDNATFLRLNDKHERSRIAVVSAESEARHEPTRH